MHHSNEAWCRPDGVLAMRPQEGSPRMQQVRGALGPQPLQTPKPQTTFLLGVCPHIPRQTIFVASGRKPKIMTVNSVLYFRMIPEDRLRTLGRAVPVTLGLPQQ